jgi:hypothetical protein
LALRIIAVLYILNNHFSITAFFSCVPECDPDFRASSLNNVIPFYCTLNAPSFAAHITMHKQIGAKHFYSRLSAPNVPPPWGKVKFQRKSKRARHVLK